MTGQFLYRDVDSLDEYVIVKDCILLSIIGILSQLNETVVISRKRSSRL